MLICIYLRLSLDCKFDSAADSLNTTFCLDTLSLLWSFKCQTITFKMIFIETLKAWLDLTLVHFQVVSDWHYCDV